MTRTDEASRIIAATPAEIWSALVDPSDVAAWLPPDDMIGRIDEWDVRPGGVYRITLTYAEPGWGKSTADTDVVTGRFVEVVPQERLVQEADFTSDDPAFAGTMRMTWSLAADASSTVVTIRADDVPVGISAEDHAEGLASSLENLARYVTGDR